LKVAVAVGIVEGFALTNSSGDSQNRSLTREMTPALIILLFTLGVLFFGGVAFSDGWQGVVRAVLRFVRFTLSFCLPLYVLPGIYGFIVKRKRDVLLQTDQKQALEINPIKHWIFRPFQGIGIGLLFSTKLLTILQVIAGTVVKSSLLIPEGHFELRRLILTTVITIFVSLFLAVLWTLDDTGLRYFNRKYQELKMIGKYVGTLMPTIFGFYGVFSLFANYPAGAAFVYVCKIAIVLYPPLTVFAVLHMRLIRSRTDFFFRNNEVRRGGIWSH
jgi:hypothetical protein